MGGSFREVTTSIEEQRSSWLEVSRKLASGPVAFCQSLIGELSFRWRGPNRRGSHWLVAKLIKLPMKNQRKRIANDAAKSKT